ncbi:MAG: transglycosylase SLT domain-containing protein [Hydrogenovibrio sp.]|nr:transglycosylase SLT domain-containing protein [Hydrogenovibrio sp.]
MRFNRLSQFLSKTLLTMILCGLLPASASQLDRTTLTEQQRQFLSAYEAIRANDRPLIAHYKKILQDYELYPYLSYLDYKHHFEDIPERLIAQFIKRYPNNTLTPILIRHYLEYLGENNLSKLYLKYYPKFRPHYDWQKCYYYTAKIRLKQSAEILTQAQAFWRTQVTLPKTCRALDHYLHQNRKITGSMVWDRIELNMNKGKLQNAEKIARDLSKKERHILDYWIKAYKTPKLVVDRMPGYLPAVIRKAIFKQGVIRLSYSEPKLALKTLTRRSSQYGISSQERHGLERQISLRFAYKYLPEAQQYLKKLDQAAQNEKVLNWRLQLAIRNSNWVNYLDLYDLLPEEMQRRNRWEYWKARAYEELNEPKEANQIFSRLAKKRNFYGFLSADKLEQPYQFNPAPSKKFDYQRLAKKYPQLKVIKELLAIHWKLSVKREWYHLLKHIDPDDIEAIANSMSDWDQHHLAIQTIAKAKMWDDLSLRFPTPYKQPILKAAKAHTVDPAWVYGVMRRESAFATNISSSVGAIGLMQLMPSTARYIGRKLGLKHKQYSQLTNAKSNIQLGSAYLSYLEDKYNGNRILATAAYNAGPRRVDSWIPEDRLLSADQWIDTIPFSETRAYVKAVMEYTTIFKSVLNKRYDRLRNFMKPIGARQNAAGHNKKDRSPSRLSDNTSVPSKG